MQESTLPRAQQRSVCTLVSPSHSLVRMGHDSLTATRSPPRTDLQQEHHTSKEV
jgi:hypothetical protein